MTVGGSGPDVLVSPCPGCGRPRPVQEGQGTKARCAGCGQEHPFPPDVLRAAQTYRTERANMPLQIQQASDIAGLTAHASAYLHRFRRATAVLAAPLLVLFVIGLGYIPFTSEPPDDELARKLYAPVFFAPLLVLLLGGVIAGVRLWRSREAVQSLLWARPLADVPGAFACRMCGAPLVADESRSATITCSFCRCENMVGPDISRKAASLARVDYARHASDVVRTLGGARGSLDATGRPSWSARFAIAVPLLTLLASWGAAHLLEGSLSRKVKPPNRSARYVLWRCPSDAFAQVARPDAPPPSESCRVDGEVWSKTPATFAEVDALPLRSGKKVETFSDGFGRNQFRVEDFFGDHSTGFVAEANVAVPPRTKR